MIADVVGAEVHLRAWLGVAVWCDVQRQPRLGDAYLRQDDVANVVDGKHRVLAPEGGHVARVPACSWVGPDASGAKSSPRLYDPEGLRESLEEAALRPMRLRYWDFLGVPSAYVAGRWMGREQSVIRGVPACERPRHWWDNALDVWFRTVENRFGFPTGVSLIAVATPYLEKARVKREAMEKGMTPSAAREAYEPTAISR